MTYRALIAVQEALTPIMDQLHPEEADLGARLLTMQRGSEVRARCRDVPTSMPVDNKSGYHGTSWRGLLGILRDGFRSSSVQPRRHSGSLVFCGKEQKMAWRYPMGAPPERVVESLAALRIMVVWSVPRRNLWKPPNFA